MALTAETWPIAASLLPFTDGAPDGPERDAEAEARWDRVFETVGDAGFDAVDLTDTWLPFGDLSAQQRAGMKREARRECTDGGIPLGHPPQRHGRTGGAAQPRLQPPLHRPRSRVGGGRGLSRAASSAQSAAARPALVLDGGRAPRPQRRPATWDLAVRRFRELGRHAEEVGVLLSLEMYEHTYLGTGVLGRAARRGDRHGRRRPQSRYRQPGAAARADRGLARRRRARPSRTRTTGT